jgi:hypothetical protein
MKLAEKLLSRFESRHPKEDQVRDLIDKAVRSCDTLEEAKSFVQSKDSEYDADVQSEALRRLRSVLK